MKTFIYQIKKIIKQSILADFYFLLTAPIDGEVTKFSKNQPITARPNQNFSDYVFGNVVIGQSERRL
ncbi:MAG: hypothetical protein HY426_01995 [Candidatus Levybacteria bacterium]|nr:hypothetical protein [Candidatus Levybacteria bacterium]